MKLDAITNEVANQLDQQAKLGIKVDRETKVPEKGPANRGVWLQVRQVTAVFADLKRSTALNVTDSPQVAARAYTYFIRAMTVTLERFNAGYIDIQGDGIFGLFSGRDSVFTAAACARTMRTLVDRDVASRFKRDTNSDWRLTAGIGIDRGTLLVRRLGLRGTKQNEVWAGKPVNTAAKLSSVASSNQIVVSDRVFRQYENAPRWRKRALLMSCGCSGRNRGPGLVARSSQMSNLWAEISVPKSLGLDIQKAYRMNAPWCKNHGPQFCEAIITGERAK